LRPRAECCGQKLASCSSLFAGSSFFAGGKTVPEQTVNGKDDYRNKVGYGEVEHVEQAENKGELYHYQKTKQKGERVLGYIRINFSFIVRHNCPEKTFVWQKSKHLWLENFKTRR
jgi:hypothetical protein